MFTRIILASDGSEYALRATDKLIELVNEHSEAKVTVLYAINSTTSKGDVLMEMDDPDAIARRRKERLAGTEQKLRDAHIDYETVVLRGEPGPAIVRYANEHDPDLVVIGSRGLNTFQEMVLGSVSHKVAKRVNAPVMIVK